MGTRTTYLGRSGHEESGRAEAARLLDASGHPLPPPRPPPTRIPSAGEERRSDGIADAAYVAAIVFALLMAAIAGVMWARLAGVCAP